MTAQASRAATEGGVLAIDVGGTLVKTAIVTPSGYEVARLPTVTPDAPWSIERLGDIAQRLYQRAIDDDRIPEVLSVAVPGQVDDHHGVVQYSANLPWHDVAVADRLAEVVPCAVEVRHDVRAGALAEATLGGGADSQAVLFVAIGTGIAAAGVTSGMVVADHAGAGEIGQIRIRSGNGVGHRLEQFASARAIARRYAERTGTEGPELTAAHVHERIAHDADARAVWDEAIDALGDALEWSVTLFAPQVVVIGGGLVEAGDDLLGPLRAGLRRRLGDRPVPEVVAARFGADAGWVGAALIGWRHLGWPIESLAGAIANVPRPGVPGSS